MSPFQLRDVVGHAAGYPGAYPPHFALKSTWIEVPLVERQLIVVDDGGPIR